MTAWDILSGLLYLKGQILWDTPIWFLPCLFVVEAGYYGLKRWLGSSDRLVALSLLVLAAIGLFFQWDTPIRLPWGMDIALVAIGFYGLGNLVRKLPFRLPGGRKGTAIAALAFTANLGAAYLMRNDHTDMYKLHMEPRLLFYAGALLGILTWIMIARSWARSRFWQYMGRNSLAILVAQFFLFWFFDKIAHYFFHYIPEATDFSGLILTPLTVIGIIPLVYVLNRYFPFLLGKTNPRSREKVTIFEKPQLADESGIASNPVKDSAADDR